MTVPKGKTKLDINLPQDLGTFLECYAKKRYTTKTQVVVDLLLELRNRESAKLS